MSQINVELHEKYPHERIEDWEHEVVKDELGRIGFHNQAATNGVDARLPRACYFADAGSAVSIYTALGRIKQRLGRTLSAEFTLGTSFGYGLRPVKPTLMSLIATPAPKSEPPIWAALLTSDPSDTGMAAKSDGLGTRSLGLSSLYSTSGSFGLKKVGTLLGS